MDSKLQEILGEILADYAEDVLNHKVLKPPENNKQLHIKEIEQAFLDAGWQQPAEGELMTKCCLTCDRLSCPVIEAWIKETESPIESTTFYCSEYCRSKHLPESEQRREWPK